MEANRKPSRPERPPTTQLRLLPERRVAWPLDPAARRRGLAGVARARQALEAAQPPAPRLPRAS